jgi:hypothetical protein
MIWWALIFLSTAPALATPALAQLPTVDALRSVLDSHAPPRLDWTGKNELSLSLRRDRGRVKIFGRCHSGRPVVISGQGVHAAAQLECARGDYELGDDAGVDPSREIAATQLLLDGNIIVARHTPSQESNVARVKPVDLSAALASSASGDRIVLAPGVYHDLRLALSQSRGDSPRRPVVIDGNHEVVFAGATRIAIAASYIVLRGISFQEVGPGAAIVISGRGVRLTELEFDGCGDPRRPKAECVIIMSGGEDAELDFNTFVASKSMSIKVRAGSESAQDQPVNVTIHHNVFRDIVRLSDNGQEPIQIAGPGGGGSQARLSTRIEHNLFYRAEGDREAISLKTPGIAVRWNVFRDMDAAPNLRGSPENIISDNLLIRTRPLRVAGRNNTVTGNIVLCPSKRRSGILISHGSPGYAVASDNVVRHNVIVGARSAIVFVSQTNPFQRTAYNNDVTQNTFYLPRPGSGFRIIPQDIAEEVFAENKLAAAHSHASLCR